MQTPSLPKLVLYALTVVLAVALVFAASTTTTAFGAYNVQWDGTSDFRALADQQAEDEIALETAPYETADANSTIAIVLAPTDTYTTNESQHVRAFVERGGTVVIADDFGPHGNALLQDIGASARFDGAPLRDERQYYRAPSLPIAPNVTDSPYTAGVDQLTLNGGTAVIAGSADPIVTTSRFAYLDRNVTGNLSASDELGAYPVVTSESVGSGQVIAVSDPSLFINTMLSQPDNRAFATALFETHDNVLLDYSQAGRQPPLAVAVVAFRSLLLAQLAVGTLGIGSIWGYARYRRESPYLIQSLRSLLPQAVQDSLPHWLVGSAVARGDGKIDEDAVLASLRETYPELDDATLQRMMTDIMSEGTRESDDE